MGFTWNLKKWYKILKWDFILNEHNKKDFRRFFILSDIIRFMKK